MPMIARYVASYAGYEAGTDPAATGAESGPMAVGEYGDAAYGEVYVTPTEALNAVRQTDQYMATLANDFLAWAKIVAARGDVTVQESSMLAGWQTFMNAWAAFYASVGATLSAAQQALNAREWRDQANYYLEQAAVWRNNLAATGYSPNAIKNPKFSGTGGLFQWPEVPWWVWLLGAVGVAAWLGVPQSIAAAWREKPRVQPFGAWKVRMKPETIERRAKKHAAERVRNREILIARLHESAERDRAKGIPDEENVYLEILHRDYPGE